MTAIIGIVGLIGSGKDTVGSYIVTNYDYRRDSFAKSLKDIVSVIFGWDREALEGYTKESREWREQPDIWWETNLNWQKQKFASLFPRFTPRVCLQLFGTEVMRNAFHDDIWILSVCNRIQNYSMDTVITDCRFPNELKMIQDNKGIIIRVIRGSDPEWYGVAEGANSPTFLHAPECYDSMLSEGIHISEWAWIGSKFDYIIDNNGSLADLHRNIDSVMEKYNDGHRRISDIF